MLFRNFHSVAIIFIICLVFSGCSDTKNTSENEEILKKLDELSSKLGEIDELRRKVDTIHNSSSNLVSGSLSNNSPTDTVVTDSEVSTLDLHDSAAVGDIITLKKLLSENADVNATDKLGRTPLHYAASNGRFEIIEILINNRAKINLLDNGKLTPLNHALLLGNEKTIKFLESQGAVASEVINPIVSKPKEQGDADIVLNAIINDDLTAFKRQIQLGFNLYSELPNGGKFISAIASNGSFEIFDYCASEENIELVLPSDDLLIIAINKFIENSYGDNFSKAQRVKFLKLIDSFCKVFPEIVNVTSEGYAPIHMAIGIQDTELLNIILSNKANVELKSINSQSPLIMAVTSPQHTHGDSGDHDHKESHGHQSEMVDILVKSGADIDAKGFKGRNALMEAIKTGNEDLSMKLLKMKADPNSSDTDGVTALHLAAYSGQLGLCKTLLSIGANKDAEVKVGPKLGLKPIDAARERNHKEIINLLEGKN